MESITLKYQGGAVTKDFKVLAVVGLDEAEEIEGHNAFSNTSDDGTIFENVDKVRQIVTINFGTVLNQADRDFIKAFWAAPDKTVTYGAVVDFELVNYDIKSGYAYVRKEGVKYNKALTMKFKAKNAN